MLRVLHASHKYRVDGLTKLCEQLLDSGLDVDNACTILEQAMFFSLIPLTGKVTSFIADNFEKVTTSSGFKCISCAALPEILKYDKLVVSEVKILEYALQWAEAECQRKGLDVTPSNKRATLDGALYHIRFPTMTLQELNVAVKSDIITDQEQLLIFKSLTMLTSEDKNVFGDLPFPTKPRIPAMLFLDIAEKATRTVYMWSDYPVRRRIVAS